MGKDTAQLEWTFVADDQTWPVTPSMMEQSPSMPNAVQTRTMHKTERQMAALIVMLALLLAGGWRWHRRAALASSLAQLQTTVAAEAVASPGVDIGMRPGAHLDDQQFIRGDLVMAQVSVRGLAAGDASTYRATHFYQRTDNGWQRSVPQPDWLGPAQTLTTAHFTIHYRAVDAAAVTAVAPRLDRLYEKLRRDFGLPPVDPSPDITLRITLEEQRNGIRDAERVISVRSPTLLTVPDEITPATVILQVAIYPLAALVRDEVVDQYPIEWKRGATTHWKPLLNALPLWSVWNQDDGPLASWQVDVVRWLYQNAQTEPRGARQAVPAGYAQLCRAYRVWDLSPTEMSIPLTCSEWDDQRSARDYPALPLQLVGLGQNWPDLAHDALVPSPTEPAAAIATIIDFIVTTYGRERLAACLAAVGHYEDWKSLTPSVFGVSASEFEADWLAYLEATYGAR